MKPDWHDRPTEPGLWLVHAKGSRTDVMACTIVTDEMMACIDEAIDADIDYCGPYALPPDTKVTTEANRDTTAPRTPQTHRPGRRWGSG